jgi:hypothetical protein
MGVVQLSIADASYRAALRDALSRSGPWHVEMAQHPDPALACVLVVDETTFAQLPLPLLHPERVVLISGQDPAFLTRAWDAGIVSVISTDDPLPTVLLAIMAAGLRVANAQANSLPRVISPNRIELPAPITPEIPNARPRRCKTR